MADISKILGDYLAESAARHKHLSPRQLLGVRMGLFALKTLGLISYDNHVRFLNEKKHVIAFIETDGSGADGICTATNCWMIRRTAYMIDHGKMAVTLVNKKDEAQTAVRVVPHPKARATAKALFPAAQSRWHAYLEAYAVMPDLQLLSVQHVNLTVSLSEIISRPGARVNCAQCGEEIINEREITIAGRSLCRHCSGDSYYECVDTHQTS